MDEEDERPGSLQISSYEEYKANDWKARQRASVLWLISKACENQLPSDLREPYYRDQEDQDRLKPQIVHGLSTGSLYCSALANIYADPNYFSMNHHNILQVLMRKGVYIEEPPDAALTETVLGQTAPIRMSAHMAVIEGLMSLFIKEVLIPEKVLEVVRRFSDVTSPHDIPSDSEEAAILWINKCCVKMQHRIEEDLGSFHSPDAPDSTLEQQTRPPNVPVIQDFSDLSDGCCLAAVLSFYCPNHLPWQEISFSEPVSLADSLYNLQLVQRFCDDHLQNDVCFLSLEDFLYMHHTIRQNMLAFIADLMFLFEIRPAPCVLRPGLIIEEVAPKQAAGRRYSQNGCGEGHMNAHRIRSGFQQQAISPIPDLRSNSYGGSSYSLPDINSPRFSISSGRPMERSPSTRSKGRGGETLKSPPGGLRRTHSVNLPHHERRQVKVQHSTSFGPQRNEEPSRFRSEEDEEIAGYFPDQQSPPDDSSLPSTLPGNVGPPIQEPLLPAQVKESKERTNNDTKVQERGEEHLSPSKKILHSQSQSDISKPNQRPGPEGASLTNQQDALLNAAGLEDYYNQLAQEGNTRGKGDKIDEKGKEWMAEAAEKAALESIDPYEQRHNQEEETKATTSFAQLSKLRDKPATISIVYMQHEKDEIGALKSSLLQKGKDAREERHTTFAALPNTTTWQQQSSSNVQQLQQEEAPPSTSEAPIATQLCDIRLKLEEKRRKIEQEKRRMESQLKKQRQKLGKAAFLQAVSKGGGSSASSESSPTGKDEADREPLRGTGSEATNGILCMQDIEQDLDSVTKKWLKPSPVKSSQDMLSPIDSVDDLNAEEFQHSIEQLNSSLSDLQMDISRLNQRQVAIQDLVKGQQPSRKDHNFYLHGKEQEKMQQLQQEKLQQLQKEKLQQQMHQEKIQQQIHQEKLQQQMQQEKLQQQLQQEKMQQKLQQEKLQQQMQQEKLQQQIQQHQQQLKLQEQQQLQQQRRSQWQEPLQPQAMYGQPIQHINTSPRRGQWGTPMMPMHNPQYGSLQWQPMRPASVDPQMMQMMQPQQHPGYEQRPPSALPYVEPGFTLHPGIQDQSYGSPYQQFGPANRTVYQNGPIEGAGGMYDYRQPGYQTMPNNQFDGPYQGMPPYQPSPNHRLSQETLRSPPQPINYQQPPPRDRLDQSKFQPILPERTQGQATYLQGDEVVDNFGRPVKHLEQPPSPPSKPVIGRTFRIPKSSKTGSSPPRGESRFSSSPSKGESYLSYSPKKGEESFSSSSPPSPPEEASSMDGQDPNTKATFYISFDDEQPKKTRAKKPMRPREVKARSNSSKGPSTSSFNAGSDEIEDPSESSLRTVPVVDPGVGFFIGADLVNPDPEAETEMAKKKGLIMKLSLRRRIEQETLRVAKEQEYARQRDDERLKRELSERKREEEKQRRQAILEQYRLRKAQELELEREGNSAPPRESIASRPNTLTKPKPRSTSRPRPKSMHVTTMTQEAGLSSLDAFSRGSHLSLAGLDYSDEKDSVYSSMSHRTLTSPTSGQARSLTSPTGASHLRGSFLPPGLLGRHSGPPSDGASDAGSTTSSAFTSEYTGPKLFVKPTAKSNRGIILNAINTVLAGAVNSDTKKKVLEEINRSESKHFLILFRDAGCQFRAMYSYNPDKEEVSKLYGIGPKGLTDKMMDRFYKYNSGGKCFSQVQTKHLTVTIDAVTIHNTLWSGKKALPSKKDFF